MCYSNSWGEQCSGVSGTGLAVLVSGLMFLTGCASFPAPAADNSEIVAAVEVFQDCEECPEMAVVDPGTFPMGGLRNNDAAIPVHDVTFDYSFAVGRFEITYEQWNACASAEGCKEIKPGENSRLDDPVVGVSWNDTQAYVTWLSHITGHNYRLLSEAEWEYSARAGLPARYYSGRRANRLCEIANVDDRSLGRSYRAQGTPWWEITVIGCDDGFAGVAPVGSFRPNDFGLYDMIGNVEEWTQDCYQPNYEDAPTDGSARESENCETRSVRGGTYYRYFAPYWRGHEGLGGRVFLRELGFRVARDMD